MSFTSNIFILGMFPVFIIAYYLLRNKKNVRLFLLFVFNIIFYIWGGISAAIVLLTICIITWLFCRLCENNKNKVLFGTGCVLLAIPLIFFKYINFIFSNLNLVIKTSVTFENIILPLGISFFTFQAISCLSDTYHSRLENRPTFYEIFQYLSFFPTVVSGPIMRFGNYREGMKSNITIQNLNEGILRFSLGLIKKVLIADKIAILANYYFDGVANGTSFSTVGLWIGSIAYTLQIFFDFSGYTDMAVGIGYMLGFELPENFNKPYLATSVQDFWSRWHMSLTSWFRDYIYIPLGGNRCSKTKHIRNLLVVWLVTGIWHGAEWTFVIWGLIYFVFQLGEKYVAKWGNIKNKWYGHIYTLLIVNFLWVIFRANNLSTAINYLKGMFGVTSCSISLESKALRFIPFVIIIIILCLPWGKWLKNIFNKKWFVCVRYIIVILLFIISISAVLNSDFAPYIYGNF